MICNYSISQIQWVQSFGTRSLTRNPNIADLLIRTPYMERMGTGIQRIKTLLHTHLLPPAKFSFGSHFGLTMLRASNTGDDPINKIKSSKNQLLTILSGHGILVPDPINDPIKRYLKIIQLLSETPLKRADLAASLDVAEVTVKRDMKVLRDAGIVSYEGSNKTGMYHLHIDLENQDV